MSSEVGADITIVCRLCNSSAILQPLLEVASSSELDWQEDSPGPCSSSGRGLPVYVMLPLDTVWVINRGGSKSSMLKREKALAAGLKTLKRGGVEGVMVDVWWGVVERDGPCCYDFAAYRRLFEKVPTPFPQGPFQLFTVCPCHSWEGAGEGGPGGGGGGGGGGGKQIGRACPMPQSVSSPLSCQLIHHAESPS